MTSNPKAKGSAFEREIAKTLSLWLTYGDDKKQLIRSVLSGGWQDRGTRQIGDLAPNGPKGEAFREVVGLEIKHYKAIQFWHIFSSENPTILQWWGKHSVECDEANIEPFLIMKQNYYPILLGMRPSTAQDIIPLFNEPFIRCGYYDSFHEEVLFVQLDLLLEQDPDSTIDKLNEICRSKRQ